MRSDMERASEELERRSRYLSSLILLQQRHKLQQPEQEKRNHFVDRRGGDEMTIPNQNQSNEDKDATFELPNKKDFVFNNVRVRASDMPPELQKRAFCCAHQALESMPKLHSKRLALALKKEFDSSYGPAWHCIVGTSFGSYVTHSVGGFLYFSIDKVYILLFRTAVEPLDQ